VTARQQVLRFMQLSGTPILTLTEGGEDAETDEPDEPPEVAA
jgi:hypothetical protein